MINNFKTPPYKFLSNFYPATVSLTEGGMIYRTVEHAYQAAKTLDLEAREKIQWEISPGKAKRLGKSLVIREHWDEMKLDVMYRLLLQKFSIYELRCKLLATGDEELIEGNWWGDTYWGVCRGKGENNLGKLLMKIRSELQE